MGDIAGIGSIVCALIIIIYLNLIGCVHMLISFPVKLGLSFKGQGQDNQQNQ
jgi:hypothetical protein